MPKDRTLKVGDCPWRTDGKYPGLRIGGKWLRECGFDFDDYVRVVCDKGNLKVVRIDGETKEVIDVDHTETLELECEKKHSVRYKGNGDEKSLHALYIPKSILPNPYPKKVLVRITSVPK